MSTTDTGTSDRARDVAGTAQEEGTQLAQSTADSSKQVAQTAKDEAASVVSEATYQAKSLASTAKDQARGQFDSQKSKLAGVLRTTGDELRSGSDQPSQLTSEITRRVAQQTSSIADYLEQHGPDEMLDVVRSYARRRPLAFLLLAGLAGVATGRLVKGATSAASSDDTDRVSTLGSGTAYSSTTYEGTYDTGLAEVPPATYSSGYTSSAVADPYAGTGTSYATSQGATETYPPVTGGEVYPGEPPAREGGTR